MAIDRTGISSLETGAPEITYTGDEGPKSPATEEMKMAGMMDQISLDFEQQNGYDMSLATPKVREIFIQQWMQENFYNKPPIIPFNKGGIIETGISKWWNRLWSI